MKLKLIFALFLLFCSTVAFTQNITISGNVKDFSGNNLQNTSIIISDKLEAIMAFSYTDEFGNFRIECGKAQNLTLTLEISNLGFKRKSIDLDVTSSKSFVYKIILEEDVSELNEVVIPSNQKIRIDQDTTFIKVRQFTNNTEQTLEDILKKLPGIQVMQDGSVKANGTLIDKLLIDGDDLFDKNYKLLTKNLDAKVLDEVQILAHFEDNPILKKLSSSEKVALNIKFKEGYANVWFGNGSLGLGSKNRFKGSANVGLLKKKIKLFYFGDSNNIGEKGSAQISNNQETIDLSDFESKVEKTAKRLYYLSSNDNSGFDSSQSLFNQTLTNSVSVASKVNDKIKIRVVGYYINDKQNQDSNSFTSYNFDENPISFTENKRFKSTQTLSSAEVEIKYSATPKSYFTSVSIYKNSPENTTENLFLNQNPINQNLQNHNQTFYNHLKNTLLLSENSVLHTYFYLGYNNIKQNARIGSKTLNDFINIDSDESLINSISNTLSYYGYKTTYIYKKSRWQSQSTLSLENNKENLDSQLQLEQQIILPYSAKSNFNQQIISINQNTRYMFNYNTILSSDVNVSRNEFNSKLYYLVNPKVTFEFTTRKLGDFTLNVQYNSKLPETNILLEGTRLDSYRSFITGTSDVEQIYGKSYGLNYSLFNNIKRYSVTASIVYFQTNLDYNINNSLTQDFANYNYFLSKGADRTRADLSLTNYFRKLKLSTKLETSQNWSAIPLKINSNLTDLAHIYNSSYKISGTTFFKKFINFEFGLRYDYFQTTINQNISTNSTHNFFVNLNHTLSKVWTLEYKSIFYFLNGDNYNFLNATIAYNPVKSNFSYLLILNNLANEKEFTRQSINSISYFKNSIDLVPRYFVISTKYRF